MSNEKLVSVLTKARNRFNNYARHYIRRGTELGDQKSRSNAAMAAELEEVIDSLKGPPDTRPVVERMADAIGEHIGASSRYAGDHTLAAQAALEVVVGEMENQKGRICVVEEHFEAANYTIDWVLKVLRRAKENK